MKNIFLILVIVLIVLYTFKGNNIDGFRDMPWKPWPFSGSINPTQYFNQDLVTSDYYCSNWRGIFQKDQQYSDQFQKSNDITLALNEKQAEYQPYNTDTYNFDFSIYDKHSVTDSAFKIYSFKG